MDYKYCEDRKGHRISMFVCDHRIANGQCEKLGDLCWVTRVKSELSDEERQRRSEHMKEVNRKRREAGDE